MDSKSIARRLDALQEIANRDRPCKITVTLADGTTTVTDSAGAWEICRDHLRRGDVVRFEADRHEYAGAAGAMTVLCHPAPNREVSDYE